MTRTISARAALLDDHLLVWAPIFADRCQEYDRTGFYVARAQSADGLSHRPTGSSQDQAGYKTTGLGVMLCRSD